MRYGGSNGLLNLTSGHAIKVSVYEQAVARKGAGCRKNERKMEMRVRVVVASIIVAIVLAGCGSAPSAAPTAAPPSTSVSPTAAPTVPPTKAPTAAPTAASQPATSPIPSFQEYSFESTTDMAGQTTTATMLFKNGKFRMDASAMGRQTVMISDQATKVAYMWVVGQNQATKLAYDQFEQQAGSSSGMQVLTDPSKRKLLGSETVDGQPCDIYEITIVGGTMKIWLAKANGFPVKSEMNTPMGVVTTAYKNFKTGGISDSLFELPAGMQVVDLGSILQQGGPGGQTPGAPGKQLPPIPTPGG